MITGIDSDNNFYTKNGFTNTVNIFYNNSNNGNFENIGLCYDQSSGEYFVIGPGYFILNVDDLFHLEPNEKMYPFIMARSTNGTQTTSLMIKERMGSVYQNVNYVLGENCNYVYPSLPVRFKLPDPLLLNNTYRVAASDEFSTFNNIHLNVNDLVQFLDIESINILPRA